MRTFCHLPEYREEIQVAFQIELTVGFLSNPDLLSIFRASPSPDVIYPLFLEEVISWVVGAFGRGTAYLPI